MAFTLTSSGSWLRHCPGTEKIQRASTVARVSLNHQTVTGHITLASLIAATASIDNELP